MKFYATVKSDNTVGYWEKLNAKTITGAKREATQKLGDGYIGDVIHLVECIDDMDEQRLNGLRPYTREIRYGAIWVQRY